jgi:uncharacterized membrane protein
MNVLNRFRAYPGKTHLIFFFLILILGALLRFWNLGRIPPGLNQDEAAIGLDAYSLYHYGIDHNGVSYPVNFIAWGSGQDGLYAYFVMPFVGLGLTPLVERLPMAIAGVLTLVLVYVIGRKCIGKRFGLLAMFFLAISPWHIMLSRWGLNDNILPFVFTLGVAMLVFSRPENNRYPAAMAVFGLSLYAYGAAYVATPVFLLLATIYLIRIRLLTPIKMIAGCVVFGLIALPIALFVAVNTFGWDSIHLGLMTIPRLPVKARFQNMAILFSPDIIKSLGDNLKYVWEVLWKQTDGLIWNSLARYGYAYPGAVLFGGAGLIACVFSLRRRTTGPLWILPIWLAAAFAVGLAMESNINRLNLLFIPILFMMAALLEFLFQRFKLVAWAAVAGYLGLAVLFTRVYLGGRYSEMAGEAFIEGIVPALQSVSRYPDAPVCVTDQAGVSYVYMLWVEPDDPRNYLPTIEYFDPNAQFRIARKFGRFTFGMQNCIPADNLIYILTSETPLPGDVEYRIETYGAFTVFIPEGLVPKPAD